MKIIEISKLYNGSHRNQTIYERLEKIPEGWAVVPYGLKTPNFPFGEIQVSEVDGFMTVTNWTPTDIPATEKKEETFTPSVQDDVDSMLVNHELRLTMIELGV